MNYLLIHLFLRSAVKQSIMIYRIQNKSFCLHNVCVCILNTNACMHIFKKNMFILNKFIYNIQY